MKQFLLISFALVIASFSYGQLSGTYYIPTGTPSYPTIAAAIADLNANGVAGAGVIFEVAAGHTETLDADLILTASGKSTGSIVFQKSGTGANPLITRTDDGTKTTSTLGGQGDAVIMLQGADYITFDGIDVAAAKETIEYGYYLIKTNATDGCKNVTVKNAAITMNKGASRYVTGIYASNNIPTSSVSSATGVTVTSTDGRNEDLTFTGNTIGNVFVGMLVRGYASSSPYAFYDQNLVIGSNGAGNIIQNFAASYATTSYGIYLYAQNNAILSYNTINNTDGGGTAATSTCYGIYNATGTNSVFTAHHNVVNLTTNTSALYGIYTTTTGNVFLESNSLTLNAISTTSSSFYYLYNSGGSASSLISIISNTFNGTTIPKTGSTYLIYNNNSQLTPGVTNVQYNSTVGNLTLTGATGTLYCYYNNGSPTGTEFMSGNNFSNITVTGATIFYGFYSTTAAGQNSNIYSNTISNITGDGGLMTGTNLTYANNRSVFENNFFNWTGSGTIYGISIGAGNPGNVYKNHIYNLTSLSDGALVYGIYVSAGTTINIYNNFISDLKTPAASGLNAISGIYVGGGTTVNAYYNTVFLNATSSSSSTFGTSGIYKSLNTECDFRNNNIVNKSIPGPTGGFTVVHRWSGAYNSDKYTALSNNNNFYAGTPAANKLIFYDGTNADQTMIAYQARVAPRDGNSFSENAPFVNSTTPPYNLHINTNAYTQCESGGTPITSPISIQDDIDMNPTHPRYPSPGYPFNPSFLPSAPDVGADEFAGRPNYTCIAPVPGNVISTANPICLGQSVTLSLENAIPGTGNSYQWQSAPDGIHYTNLPNGTDATYTVTPEGSIYYICIVTCINGPITVYANPVQITFPYNITSTTPGTRCGTGTVDLQATSDGGTIRWYAGTSGGTALGSGSPFTTPVINSTTTYFVGAESTAPGNGTIGTGATTSATYSNPFYSLWSNTHNQHLILASELLAAGLSAGTLTSLGIDITSAGTLPMIDFSMKIGQTTATSMPSFVSTSFTTVYTSASLMPTTGINTLEFTTPFQWDGVSNIVVEICHGNPSSTATMSRTCKADNTPFVSTVHQHLTSSTSGTVICGNTSVYSTYSVRPQLYLAGQTTCSGQRMPVVATVTPPPALTISPDLTVCNNVIVPIAVTSNLGNFDTYTWTPVSNLYMDPACTIPYVALTNTPNVYARSADQVTTSYTCWATNTTSLCVNTAQFNLTVLPADPMITSSQESLCVTGSVVLSTTPATGYGTATFQWQNSTDNITYTDIAGATDLDYTTPTITNTTYYKLLIKNSAGAICSSPQIIVVVNNPVLTSTTPGTRCGPGTVTLGATATEGIITWYTTPTGSTEIATGPVFTTPVIEATTTYYVSANSAGAVSSNFAVPNRGGTSGYTLEAGLLFDVLAPNFNIDGVHIYPVGTGAGVVNIALKNSSGTILQSLSFDCIGTTSPGIKTYVPLGWAIPIGTGYYLDMTSRTGSVASLIRDSQSDIVGGAIATNPYCSLPGVVTITSGRLGSSGTSTSYYYFYDWVVSTGCNSARLPVTATVTPGPLLTVTPAQTICSNEIAAISVTSPIANFDTYTWSPVTNLYTDPAGTIPYSALTNASTVYVKAPDADFITYLCNATNLTSLCANIAEAEVTVLPANPVISAANEAICLSGSTTLTVSPTTTYGSATFQWQSSPDNTTFTDIPGATNISYTTETINTTTYYKVLIKNGSGILCSQPQFTLQVIDPLITSTTPGTRCGFGTVVLGATGSTGSVLNWYSNAAGGSLLGSGNSFTTPVISSTTPFYVSASSGGSGGAGAVGPVDNTIGGGSTAALNYYLIFDVLASTMKLEGVHVFPGAAGNVNLHISNSSGTVLHTLSYPVSSGDVGVKTWIPINFDIPAGTSYRIGWATGGVSMYRNTSGSSFPYTLPGVVSITGHSFSGYPQYYYYFYDWRVSTGCESPRTEVFANVTPAPAITTSATPSTICVGQSSDLLVTSGNPGYVYVWTPGDIPGPAITVAPTSTTIYSVTGNDPISNCAINETVAVTVMQTPSAITIDPPSPAILPGAIQQLTASGGTINVNGIFGEASTTNTTTGYPAPYTNYYGGTKHQMMILASELTAAGFSAGSTVTSVGFTVTEVGTTFTGSLNDFQIDMGTTTETVLTSSSFIGGLTNVLPAATVPISIGHITHILATPFIWDGTSNIIIQTSYSNNNSGTSTDFVQMTNSDPGFVSTNWYRADGVTAAAVLAATAPTSSGNARPNMVLGYLIPTNMIWSPVTSLYTDALATIPYAGTSTTTVYSKPAATITYTATATAPATNCSSSQNVTVGVFVFPTVTTSAVTGITYTSATGGGNVTGDGGGTISARGVCWSTTPNPTLLDNFTVDGAGTGTFTSNITPLVQNTPYYLRAYATNQIGTSYGNEVMFTTLNPCLAPTALTAINITTTAADLDWTENGASTTWDLEWGPAGFIQGTGTMVTGLTAKPYHVSGLTPNVNYSFYVRGYCDGGIFTPWTGPQIFALIPSPTITGPATVCFGADPVIYFTESGKSNYQWTVSAGGLVIFGGGPADDIIMVMWTTSGPQSVGINYQNTSGVPAPAPTVYPVTVLDEFIAGSISANQTLCYNTMPALLTGIAPTGGDTPYSYQWENSSDGTNFNAIAGATDLNYQPGVLPQTTYFKLKQTSYSGCGTVSSNVVTVTVHPMIVAGTISSDQIICYSEDPPAMLTGTAPTGGVGPYSYQWEVSTNGTVFNDIAGATDMNYQPGVVAQTTFYKLKQISGSNCGYAYTNMVTITVYPGLNAGSISANQNICYNTAPLMLTGTPPTGGNTPYTYQWASSTNGISFNDIAGATGLNYQPDALMQTTYFLLQQTSASGCGTVLTNWVTITVNPAFAVGSIAASQIIDYNTVPAPLTGTAPTGGKSPFSYKWQSSLDGTTFTDIAGATTLNYAPAALMVTTYYRQIQTSAANCGSDVTNVVTITVNQPVVPAILTVQGVIIGSGQANCYNATQTIYVAGSGTTFVVQSGGSATMIAGQNILYYPGTTVQSGGTMHGYIAPGGPWCGLQPPAMVSVVTGTDENPLLTTQAIFKVYPNPTTGNFTVEQTGDKIYDNVKVEVYSMIGGRVFTAEMTGERKHLFSLEDVPVGVYFVRLMTGDKPETIKLIKQ